MTFGLRPGIVFASEGWGTYSRDAGELWAEHYRELAALQPKVLPWGVDELSYKAFDQAGMLHITTARREGRLVGYCIVLVKRHPHYAALCGFEDSYFLTTGERRGLTFVRMLKYTLAMLKRRGVKTVYFMTKLSGANMTKVFTRMGFASTDMTFSKSLED